MNNAYHVIRDPLSLRRIKNIPWIGGDVLVLTNPRMGARYYGLFSLRITKYELK